MAKMTKEQAVELLKNRKVYVNGKSAEIQRKLFELGWKWTQAGSLYVINENSPFIYIYKDGDLGHSAGMRLFVENQMQEISAEEILAIEIIEPMKENDIVVSGWDSKDTSCEWIAIVDAPLSDRYYKAKVVFITKKDSASFSDIQYDISPNKPGWTRLATEEEKQILIDRLKEEKTEDARRILKEVFGIEEKPECPFKPFDRVLVRDRDDEKWKANLFSHYDNEDPFGCPYYCVRDCWAQCIPYGNNEHLVGTTNNPEK